jgi:hypothetical protein
MRLQLRERSHLKLHPNAGQRARWQSSSADDSWVTRE